MLLFDDDPSRSCNRCHARAYAREGAIWRARGRKSVRQGAIRCQPLPEWWRGCNSPFNPHSAGFGDLRRYAP